MKRLLRNALSEVSYRAIRLSGATHGGLRVLMYHRVSDQHAGDRMCVPVARFADQMQHLKERGFRSVSLAQVVEWLGGGAALHERSIAITFDDGYADNFLRAVPAMAQHGFTGAFFIPTGFTEGKKRPATDHADDQPMTWAQLRELLGSGHEIGAHSITHRKLTLISPVELLQEVRGSKEALEQHLPVRIDFFCYPAGAYNADVKRAVQAAGYHGAVTVAPGANRPGTDPFELLRTEVSAFDSMWDFEKKLAGAYDWMHTAVQSVTRLTKGKQQPSNAMRDGE